MRSWLTANKRARDLVQTYGYNPVGIFARITGASNGVYEANVPVFTCAPSDEQEVKTLADVDTHWTCVQMVRANA